VPVAAALDGGVPYCSSQHIPAARAAHIRRLRSFKYGFIFLPDNCDSFFCCFLFYSSNIAALLICLQRLRMSQSATTGKKYGCSWWWLRNQGRLKDKGNDPSRAMFIGTRASIRHYARVDLARDGVRPALNLIYPIYSLATY
jgi:hypothetical protein